MLKGSILPESTLSFQIVDSVEAEVLAKQIAFFISAELPPSLTILLATQWSWKCLLGQLLHQPQFSVWEHLHIMMLVFLHSDKVHIVTYRPIQVTGKQRKGKKEMNKLTILSQIRTKSLHLKGRPILKFSSGPRAEGTFYSIISLALVSDATPLSKELSSKNAIL